MSNKFQPGNKAAVGHGAPKGNRNAMRHGLRSRGRRLATGDLPDGCEVIGLTVATLQSTLERAVAEVHGEVSLKHSLYVHSACRHEAVAQLIQRWLNIHSDAMGHAERLQHAQAIAAESDKRDRAVEKLGLDRDPGSILDELYSARVTDVEPMEGSDRGADL